MVRRGMASYACSTRALGLYSVVSLIRFLWDLSAVERLLFSGVKTWRPLTVGKVLACRHPLTSVLLARAIYQLLLNKAVELAFRMLQHMFREAQGCGQRIPAGQLLQDLPGETLPPGQVPAIWQQSL